MEITLRRTLQEKQSEPRGSPWRIINTKPKPLMVQTFRESRMAGGVASRRESPRSRESLQGGQARRYIAGMTVLLFHSKSREPSRRRTRHDD
ncbi:hypothetical protein RHGRI_016422 [Rhododendron griersonianum]|uniref:Uncharacterized protein n=1 Tax=Rhododendron griersonianum TaxID=479676 RepID=A0AAV6JU24_9ERIC|nr:hypothetical protein RHGRI_016422 [Rhododendron griersonianum]